MTQRRLLLWGGAILCSLFVGILLVPEPIDQHPIPFTVLIAYAFCLLPLAHRFRHIARHERLQQEALACAGRSSIFSDGNAMEVSSELEPFYNVTFILCSLVFCSKCRCEVPYTSSHPQFTDGNYYDQAVAMKTQGWVIHERVALDVFCPSCAESHVDR